MRGCLTEEIKKLGRMKGVEVETTAALRLLPYIHYCLMNTMPLDPNKMNQEDREALKVWKDKGWLEGGASGLKVTRQFWNGMNHLLWFSYVQSEGQEIENV